MKSEWRKNIEKEFDAREAAFLAQQPKPNETQKGAEKQNAARVGNTTTETDEGREQRNRDERRIEDQIRMLMGYSNVEIAREKEIEFDVKNRMFREGWEVNGSINLAFEPDLVELLAGELDNENYRIVILPKEKRAVVFRARIRKRG